MKDEDKTREQLENELLELRRQVSELSSCIDSLSQLQQEDAERAERTLHEQDHFLQRLIDTIPNPIFYKDVQGLFQGCNAAYTAYIGLTKEEIIGKSVYEVYPGDLADIYYAKDTALFREPGVQIYESSFRIADGTRRDIVFNKATYTSTDGTLAGLVGIIVDISDNKRAQKALKAERTRLFSLLDALPAIVYLQSPDHSIRFSNLSFWERFGKPEQRPCYEILHRRKEPCKECRTFRIFDTKTPQEWEWNRFDGRTYRIYTYPFSDIDGSPLALVLGIDITDYKRAEEALVESEERFSKAFNASPSMMVISRLSDNIIIDANDSFLTAAGYRREEVIGRTAKNLNLWDSPMNRTEAISLLRKGYPVRNLESSVRTKSGKIRLGLISAELIELSGEPCFLVAVNDITDRKQLEKEMARLERLNLVGEMAAGIGHEVRNPMTTVRGFLQMLGGKEECVKYKGYFDLMIEELDRANSIITEFLSLAKNKAIDLTEQNLNSIIRVLSPLIQADATRADKDVKVKLEDIPDLFLDEKEIRQLLLNLVRNGLEAMSPGGVLTIRTFLDCDEVVLAVQDQGMEMEPGVLEKLGTPFFTTKDNGTGLGLAVCYSIAARHNATIQVKTSSKGTTFFVRFNSKEQVKSEQG